jgi:hypothetical protein
MSISKTNPLVKKQIPIIADDTVPYRVYVRFESMDVPIPIYVHNKIAKAYKPQSTVTVRLLYKSSQKIFDYHEWLSRAVGNGLTGLVAVTADTLWWSDTPHLHAALGNSDLQKKMDVEFHLHPDDADVIISDVPSSWSADLLSEWVESSDIRKYTLGWQVIQTKDKSTHFIRIWTLDASGTRAVLSILGELAIFDADEFCESDYTFKVVPSRTLPPWKLEISQTLGCYGEGDIIKGVFEAGVLEFTLEYKVYKNSKNRSGGFVLYVYKYSDAKDLITKQLSDVAGYVTFASDSVGDALRLSRDVRNSQNRLWKAHINECFQMQESLRSTRRKINDINKRTGKMAPSKGPAAPPAPSTGGNKSTLPPANTATPDSRKPPVPRSTALKQRSGNGTAEPSPANGNSLLVSASGISVTTPTIMPLVGGSENTEDESMGECDTAQTLTSRVLSWTSPQKFRGSQHHSDDEANGNENNERYSFDRANRGSNARFNGYHVGSKSDKEINKEIKMINGNGRGRDSTSRQAGNVPRSKRGTGAS